MVEEVPADMAGRNMRTAKGNSKQTRGKSTVRNPKVLRYSLPLFFPLSSQRPPPFTSAVMARWGPSISPPLEPLNPSPETLYNISYVSDFIELGLQLIYLAEYFPESRDFSIGGGDGGGCAIGLGDGGSGGLGCELC